MVDLQEALKENLQQGLCNILSTAQRTAELGSGFYDSIGLRGAGQTSSQAAQMWSAAAGLACNRPPQDLSGETGPRFDGGQCAVDYNVTASRSFSESASGSPAFTDGPFTQRMTGPVKIVSLNDNETGNVGEAIRGTQGRQISASSQTRDVVFLFDISTARVDGQPDTCGDPPGQGPPYEPGDFTTNPVIPYDDESGNPQTVSPTVVYKPVTVSPDGQFSVPISVEFQDGSSVFGDFNLTTGDINIGGGNGAGDGVSGPDRELEPEEQPTEGEQLIGVRVVSTIGDFSAARVTEINGIGNAPNLLVPRVASVLFRYESSVGNGWGQPIDVKTDDAVILADGDAVEFAVVPQQGVTVQSRAIVRPKCPKCS